jgi:hypothetical protein
MHRFVKDGGISRDPDITADGEGEPEEVVGTMRTDTAIRRRMPPMLNVSFRKLMSGTTKQMLTNKARFGIDDGHGVLELIAKSECATGLIVSTSGPEA